MVPEYWKYLAIWLVSGIAFFFVLYFKIFSKWAHKPGVEEVKKIVAEMVPQLISGSSSIRETQIRIDEKLNKVLSEMKVIEGRLLDRMQHITEKQIENATKMEMILNPPGILKDLDSTQELKRRRGD